MAYLNWEDVDLRSHGNSTITTVRAKVFGGWLVRTISDTHKPDKTCPASVSITFVPDPDKRWEV